MAKVSVKNNTTITEIANVMVDPSWNKPQNHQTDASLNRFDNVSQQPTEMLNGQKKETLSYQDWAIKYHQ